MAPIGRRTVYATTYLGAFFICAMVWLSRGQEVKKSILATPPIFGLSSTVATGQKEKKKGNLRRRKVREHDLRQKEGEGKRKIDSRDELLESYPKRDLPTSEISGGRT